MRYVPVSNTVHVLRIAVIHVYHAWDIVYLEPTLQDLILLQAVLAELLAHVVAYKMGDATL